MIKVVSRDTPRLVAEYITNYLFQIHEEIGSSSPMSVALSGGSTPISLYEYWNESRRILDADWMHFFWVDERMVPMESPDSNYGNAYREFFNRISPHRVHPILFSDSPIESVAKVYSDEVLQWSLNSTTRNTNRLFDVVILGMGEDGHTSSLFPGQELFDLTEPYIVSRHPINGIERIALSYEGIAQSSKLLFHVLGHAKGKMLTDVLDIAASLESTPEQVKSLPSAYVIRQAWQDITVVTDITI